MTYFENQLFYIKYIREYLNSAEILLTNESTYRIWHIGDRYDNSHNIDNILHMLWLIQEWTYDF